MIRWLLPLALIAGTATAQAGPISSTAFGDRVAAEARRIGRTVTVIDPHSLRLTDRDGSIATLNIDNAYAQYRADPRQLDAQVARFVRLMTAEAGGEGVDQLVIIVRPTDYLDRSMPAGANQSGFLPKRPMAGDLSYFLAVDSPETIRMATPADLARWHLTEAQAWPRATANILTRMGTLVPIRVERGQGASGFGGGNGLAPSMLADPSLCGPAAPEGLRGQVVLVYARDSFIYAVPGDRLQTAAFWTEVRRVQATHSTLSETPLTCRAGRWIVAPAP